jgi:hypothetical protein
MLPTLQAVIVADPESAASKKLDGLLKAQLQAYDQLMAENGLTRERQDALLKQVAAYSEH